jgi:hypothetical protein
VHPVRLSFQRSPDTGEPQSQPDPDPEPEPSAPVLPAQRPKRESALEQSHTVAAILTHKIDERKRVVDSNGHSKTYDEYYEMVFETRHGETLRLAAPRIPFKETPFNQDGILTYAGDQFISFRYSKPTINHHSA